jgi:protease-4
MGGLAASGGYYAAMPCKTLYAERTTLTGSIGVFASFPNVRELTEKVGIKMEVIKRGDVKDAGSPFKDMSPEERLLWQDMVNQAYDQFLQVVREGRPDIKDKLTEAIDKTVTVRDPKTGKETQEVLTRSRVDGGIFTATEAKELGLVDRIGYLEDAIKDVASQAGLGDDYRVVTYQRPLTLANLLFGAQSPEPGMQLDAKRFAAAATPRLWYLAPQSELAGLLTAAGR